LSDLESLLGIELPRDFEGLNEIFSLVKGEVTRLEGDELSIEIKDSNRPDLWSAEGISRALKALMDLGKPRKYFIAGSSGVTVLVDSRLEGIRPYIGCAVLRSITLNDAAIKGLMHLQDKLDGSYGRGRKKTSIGLYDFDLINPPIYYEVSGPDETAFIPLGFDENLTLSEILERHPKGIQYGHIVKPYEAWPILKDSKGSVLSFPPIINSNDLGRITEDTSNVLVEVTGTSLKTVLDVLEIMVAALADRGGSIETVTVRYPYRGLGEDVTPKLEEKTWSVKRSYINEVLGLNLETEVIINLLERAGFEAYNGDEIIRVKAPFYRKDIIHPVDIVEDVAIAYGFNRIEPEWPKHQTFGALTPETKFYDKVRELLIGLGFQEVLTFTFSNQEKLFDKMRLNAQPVIEVENPKMTTYTCIRNWLIPSLIEFLSHNTHVEYPQRIFEVGDCVEPDLKRENRSRERKSLAAVIADPSASYTDIRSILDSILLNLGLDCRVRAWSHPSFIEGRVAQIQFESRGIGFLGEIHPEVLEKWGLEVPVSALEVDLSFIFTDSNMGKV
jgi:phenylalanyl-tRNA synthetase beta chain